MNKKNIGIFMVILMLLITCFTTNVSAMKDVDQIQEEVEDLLGMELQLCVQFNITEGINVIGYDLLFMPLDIPEEDINSSRFFEAYYIDGYDTDVDERYLEDSVYEQGPEEIISEDPLVTAQSINLSGNITMTTPVWPIVFTRLKERCNPSFAKVTAQGIFIAFFGSMKYIIPLSYEKAKGSYQRLDWYEEPSRPPDRSYGKVTASGTYWSPGNPYFVKLAGAWVQQFSDHPLHRDSDHWTEIIPI